MGSITIDRNGFLANVFLAQKGPCRAGSTAALTLSGEQTVDGVALVAEDRVLVKNQSSSIDNGIYIVKTAEWERADDLDRGGHVDRGSIILVTDGTVNAMTLWVETASSDPVPGQEAITFSRFFGITGTDAGTSGYHLVSDGTTGVWRAQFAVNIKDPPYNAAGNGVTDDSTVINTAITAVNAAGGGIIYFPVGTYIIGSTVTIRSKVTLQGAGIDATIFKAKASLNATMFQTLNTESLFSGTTETGEQYWGIERCTIDGNNDNNSSGDAIKTYSRCWRLNQVKITDAAARGINSKWGEGAAYDDDDELNFDPFMEVRLNDVYIGYCRQEGIYWDGPHDTQWDNVLVALCSHDSSGTYDGIFISSNAGGHMATNCHSWGDTQRYAWNIEAASTHFANCEADDAATALIRINSDDCTWVGGTQIGGFYSTPPSTGDKNLKGFVFGTSAFRPHIVTSVRNCPNGAIDFTNVGNLGGFIQILGAIDSALQTAQTGQATYGFQGTVPTSFDVLVNIFGVGNNFAVNQSTQPILFPDGSASFPSITNTGDIDTGMYFAADDQIGWACGGTGRLLLNGAIFSPVTNDGTALGSGSLAFSDLFLASGGVINFNNGDVTITHSANALAFAGASSGYTFDAPLLASAGSESAPSVAFSGDSNTGMYSSGTDEIGWTCGGGRRASLTSAGIFSTRGSDASAVHTRYSADAFGPSFYIEKSRNATVGSHTVVQSGDTLGSFIWQGSDGDSMEQAAQIRGEVDGTPGSADMPGRLIFATSADGSASPTERMRIDSAGLVRVTSGNIRLDQTPTAVSGAGPIAIGSASTINTRIQINMNGTTYWIPATTTAF